MIEKSLCEREFCMFSYLTALLDKCNINVVLEKWLYLWYKISMILRIEKAWPYIWTFLLFFSYKFSITTFEKSLYQGIVNNVLHNIADFFLSTIKKITIFFQSPVTKTKNHQRIHTDGGLTWQFFLCKWLVQL